MAAPRGKKVVVLAGTGGNGGGAPVCARRLHTWGALVQVVVTHPSADFTPVPADQLDILQRMNVPVAEADALTHVHSPELIVDGLIGYRLKGAPHGTVADLSRWANAQAAPILALDVPSGVDGTTGTVLDPAIKATVTMTLALPKAGLHAPEAQVQGGELYLADIGVPPSLYAEPVLSLRVGRAVESGRVVDPDPILNKGCILTRIAWSISLDGDAKRGFTRTTHGVQRDRQHAFPVLMEGKAQSLRDDCTQSILPLPCASERYTRGQHRRSQAHSPSGMVVTCSSCRELLPH